jgi:hypothetical protein
MVLDRACVEPSDMVAADRSCVVVVPRARAADLLRVAEEIGAKEHCSCETSGPGRTSQWRAGATATARCDRGARRGCPQAGAGTGDDAASRRSSQPARAPRPEHGF